MKKHIHNKLILAALLISGWAASDGLVPEGVAAEKGDTVCFSDSFMEKDPAWTGRNQWAEVNDRANEAKDTVSLGIMDAGKPHALTRSLEDFGLNTSKGHLRCAVRARWTVKPENADADRFEIRLRDSAQNYYCLWVQPKWAVRLKSEPFRFSIKDWTARRSRPFP
ncbi:MAG: hypothetical protein HY360_19925 [Verrucomicrobia bacterium]|nr:hypothetical protein [Verrucomicrobiota bacterium]